MNSLRLGLLLGFRQIQRANIWTNALIIFVMMITFLNLIAVSGILVGLIVGSERAAREKSISDLIITSKDNEDSILETETIRRELRTIPEIAAFTTRYKSSAQIEANYTTRSDLQIDPNTIGVGVTGIDPVIENGVTNLRENIVEGEYLDQNESGYILLGALTVDRYTSGFADIASSLKDVRPGDKVRVTIGTATQEFTIKGIINAKGGDISRTVFMPERELRRLEGRVNRDAEEIAIKLVPSSNAVDVKATLLRLGFGEHGKVRTFDEALPKFLTDIKNTFNILGTFVGSIGIVVASITIFIIIFINAISRRRQIGILKGIGIDRHVIEIAYVLQAAFYALAGSLLGAIITYGFLIGFFDRNPINFPFSDGILVAEPLGTLIRFSILFGVTLLAGFIPAWIIVRQNTLNSILGRK